MFLEKEMRKRYTETRFSFYFSKWKKNVHMGLDMSLLNYSNCCKMVFDIENIWLEKKTDGTYKFVNPTLIHTTKWEFDYVKKYLKIKIFSSENNGKKI